MRIQLRFSLAITSIPNPSVRMFWPMALMMCPQSEGTVICPLKSISSGTTEYAYVFIYVMFDFCTCKVIYGSAWDEANGIKLIIW